MKNTFFLLLIFAFSATTFTACKKDKDEDSVQKRITAKWIIDKVEENAFEDGTLYPDTDDYSGNDNYFDFRSNGVFEISVDGDTDQGSWSLIGDSKVKITETDVNDEIIFDIKTLTNNSLVLYQKETDGADYYEVTVYLQK